MAFRLLPPRRWRLRVLVATLFLPLLAVAGLAIVGYGYRATSALLLAAGDEEFLHVAERTADEVRSLLTPAGLLVELLARHPLTRSRDLRARLDSLPLLAGALTAHPEISAVYAGFGNGDFFLVRSLPDRVRRSLGAPPGTAFLVQSLAAADGPAGGRYLFLDARLGVVRDEPRPGYRFDPRVRDWYRQALSSAGLVRTSPYVFFTTREVGTTLARRAGSGPTVVGADITLRELSDHLARSRVTPSTRLALVDGLGLVIAYSDPGWLVPAGSRDDPTMTRLADLGQPLLERLFTEADGARGGHVRLSLGGREWVGVTRGITTIAGQPLRLLLVAPRAELTAEAGGVVRRQALIGLGVLGLALALVWLLARRISQPLETLARSVERIGGGDLDSALPDVRNPLEVGALRDVADEMRRALRGHIEERAARLAQEQRRARELEIARQIQESMLPGAPPAALGGRFVIAAALQPAREVGGDLYDFFVLHGRRLVVAIADVADKGMPAALLMARVTGLLRAIGRGETGPGAILRELDGRLSQNNDMCMFVTMACAVVDGDRGELQFASAGHERPVLRRAGGATRVLTLEGGPALGLGGGEDFPVWTTYLAPGDALVLCTDGVTEAFDADGVAFGLERFRRVVAETGMDVFDTLSDRLARAVEEFSSGGLPRDDMAMLAVQYRPEGVTVEAGQWETWRLSVAGDEAGLSGALQCLEGVLRARGVPPGTVHDCVLVLEELLTNVGTHAYRGEAGGLAQVAVELPPGAIRIRIADEGPAFDPQAAPAPDLEAAASERPIGQLGLVLVRHLVERWNYAREGATNVHTLEWSRPDESWEGRLEALTPATGGGVMALDIETGSGSTERRITLRGRLDSLTAPQLDAALDPVLTVPSVRSLVFELGGLEYISSAGIRCIMRARKAVEGRGGRVAIVDAQPAVLKVFEIVKALPSDQVFASQAELDAYLARMQRRARDGS